jgi:hypothetical protein
MKVPANSGNNNKYQKPDDGTLVINQLQSRVADLERRARSAPWYSVLSAVDATERDALIGTPAEGMLAVLTSLNQLQAYTGTSWQGLVDYLVITPVFFLTRTTATSCTSGADTTISWENSIIEQPDGWWSSGTDVTVPYTGFYILASYSITASGSATGKRQNTIRDSGNNILGAATMTPNNTSDGHPQTAFAMAQLDASDTVNVKIFQNGGIALNATGSWFGGVCIRRDGF